MTHVGGRIRTLRAERQMTLPALATKAGLSKGLLSKLENTLESNPSMETLNRVAKALDVTIGDLLESGKIQAKRVIPEEIPPWFAFLRDALSKEGKQLDEDILQALYVLQSRKGSSARDEAAWLYMYKSLEISFANAKR